MQEEADRQLDWFKDVEKFYGSVEKSSLTRAQEINEHGVYMISKRKGERKLTLENAIHLALVKDKGEETFINWLGIPYERSRFS